MIRQVEVIMYYEVPDENEKYLTPKELEEELVYDTLHERYSNNETFRGLRVDVSDFSGERAEERKRRLERFIG